MSRALELVRNKAWPGLIGKFVQWVNNVPMKDMDYYIDVLTKQGIPNFYGNCELLLECGRAAAGSCCRDCALCCSGLGVCGVCPNK